MKDKNRRLPVMGVLVRIILFILYYVLLVAVGVLTILAVFHLTMRFFVPSVSLIRNGYIMICIIVAWVGLCCFALMFSLFLIKPLFSFTKSHLADNCIEVTGKDCPLLFKAIEDIVKHTGNKSPKHVYLSADVNACVFFDSSLWSIFLPVKKNLIIGLGLFEGMSLEEVKAVLAHEFGHFAQGSMRVSSMVYAIHQILFNLTYTHDFWDRMLEKWCWTSNNFFRFFGILTRDFSLCIRQMNNTMYGFVEKAYMKLSRQMEFDADDVSCEYVGHNVFTSAICKVDVNSHIETDVRDILGSLISDGKVIGNYFTANSIVRQTIPEHKRLFISYDVPLLQPLNSDEKQSRVGVENVWQSHPSLIDRIDNSRRHNNKEVGEPIRAIEIIPVEIAQKVSDAFLGQYINIKKCEPLSNENFGKWVGQYLEKNYIPSVMRAFYGRHIFSFDLEAIESDTATSSLVNPFNGKCRKIIDQYQIADADWNLLLQIKNRELVANKITYNGQLISRKELPIEEHRAYVESLAIIVAGIDEQAYKFLQMSCNKEQKPLLKSLYRSLFYTEEMLNINLASIIEARDNLTAELKRDVLRTKDELELLEMSVERYVDFLLQCIKDLDLQQIENIAGTDYIKRITYIREIAYRTPSYLDGTYLNTMVTLFPNELVNIHRRHNFRIRKELSEMALPFYKDDCTDNDLNSLSKKREIRVELPEENDIPKWNWEAIRPWFYFFGFVVILVVLFLCLQKSEDKKSIADKQENDQEVTETVVDTTTMDVSADYDNLNDIRFKNFKDGDWFDNEYIRALRHYLDDFFQGKVEDSSLEPYRQKMQGQFVLAEVCPYIMGGLLIRFIFVDSPNDLFSVWVYSGVDENTQTVVDYSVRQISIEDDCLEFTREEILQIVSEHPELKMW